jgi:FADH2 O2-dependent halogenase
MARRLGIPSGLHRTHTNAGLLFSHFDGVRLFSDVVPGLANGPYPDDWAAVHHIIDEGWMYSLRFDHGVTSAGFVLSARGQRQLPVNLSPDELWRHLLARYPTVGALFGSARPLMPIAFRKRIQHRITRAAGDCWALLPHAYGFVDPLFSTGIAWSLKAIERLALCFEHGGPNAGELARYDAMLSAEADQIDLLVAGAYESMAHFEVFAAQAMIYFAAVSFAEARQRLARQDSETAAWTGFLGVGDPQLGPLPRASFRRLGRMRTREDRRLFVQWVRRAIAPRNVCGFANPDYSNLYPVDLDELVRRHGVLGMSRDAPVSALPALRGGA